MAPGDFHVQGDCGRASIRNRHSDDVTGLNHFGRRGIRQERRITQPIITSARASCLEGANRKVSSMSTYARLMVVGLVAAALVGCGSGEPIATTTTPPPTPTVPDPTTTTEPPPDGQEVFARSCASCHGADYEGSEVRRIPALGPGSNAMSMTDEQLRVQISEGGERMPSMTGRGLTHAQIDAVIVHLREVQSG